MRPTLVLLLLMKLAADAETRAADQAEELPPPKEEQSVLVNSKPEVSSSLKVRGWSLVGPSGRHYCVGTTALADYQQGSQRHLVSLEVERPADNSTPDENFVYFRETITGHRWAIARHPSADHAFPSLFSGGRLSWRLATFSKGPSNLGPGA